MNREEFNEYLVSFHKRPGEYTEDEILDICLQHRALSEGKNWVDLTKILGVNKSPEALRKWAYRNSNILKDLKSLKDEVIEAKNNSDEEYHTDDPQPSDFAELYKQKTEIRDIWNAYRSNLRNDARFERLTQSIENTVDRLNELEKCSYKGYPLGDLEKQCSTREAVMLISDLHIGVCCNSFYNKYNIEIAKKRLEKYVIKTIAYCKQNLIQRLNICNLGDAIQGIIHTNARIEAETDAVSQTMIAAELIAEALNKLQEAAPEVIYRSCSDNHSRLMSDKEENLEPENLGRIIDWYLKLRLKNTDIIFAEDNIDYAIGKFKLLNGKNVIFSHGHQDSKNSVFQNYVGATREYIDYILLGHFHSGQMKTFQSCKVFTNGSVAGTENYALGKRLFSNPEQTLLLFINDDTIAYNIDLSL